MRFLEVVAEFTQTLDALEIPYMIGGSLASTAWGEWRTTNDADIAVSITKDKYLGLQLDLPDSYHLEPTDPEVVLNDPEPFRSAQVIHMDELVKIDLFLLDDSTYSFESLARARNVELVRGYSARIAAPEDIVVSKLRWFELGNRVSDRQWNDIVQVLEIQQGRLDYAYLSKWAAHFGLSELLQAAQDQIIPVD